MRTADFDYDLPVSFIAQTPLEQRDQSRLMVLDRTTGNIQHTVFSQIGDYLKAGDVLVVNETRVIPARLFARKLPSGGRVEILLLRKIDDLSWEALAGGKGLKQGKRVEIEVIGGSEKSPVAEVVAVLDGAVRVVRFDQPVEPFFPSIGHVPLPPYIHHRLDDPERYQTVYAKSMGSAAAPTAGLHFTPQLIDQLQSTGIQFARLTLHVGLDTFAPVNEIDPSEHKIHTEWCQISQKSADLINQAKGNGSKVVAVGTTSVRTLESAAWNGKMRAFEGPTNLYILPGFKFQIVDAMVTNFHLPRSTLIMLVSAFAGRELLLNAYEAAKVAYYRFYSFGDAMLIL